jgi:hypothetical protein
MIIFNFFEKFSAHILCFSGNNIPVPTKRRCPHGQQEQQPEQESEQEPEQQGQQSEQGSEHQQREQLPLNAYKVKEPQALPAVLFLLIPLPRLFPYCGLHFTYSHSSRQRPEL